MPTTITFKNRSLRQMISPLQQAELRRRAFLSKLVQEQWSMDGVFEGGGALGTAYLGGLRALRDNGIWFKRVAGNSAGAITAAMIAVGFTAHEIQWLSSAFSNAPALEPDTLSPFDITSPIPFADFLDLPTISSITTNRRNTLLWNALKGTVLDMIGNEIGRQRIPSPIQSDMVNAVELEILGVPFLEAAIRAVPDGTQALRTALNVALAPLPDTAPRVRDFVPILNLLAATENLRSDLADRLWDAIIANDPMTAMMTNLIHEGSIFEGTVFLNTLKELFGKKVHGDPARPVRFRDLKIPLAVIAADIDTGRMKVYSSGATPDSEVAEAVRRSMSIPFVFEPRGNNKQLVDGGLCSNFPVWLFSSAGDSYWNQADISNTRVKIGFSLDETKAAPTTWNVEPARFEVSGNPPHVNGREVLAPILSVKLIELGVPSLLAETAANTLLGLDGGEPEIELFQQIMGVTTRGLMNTEESVRKVTVTGLMHRLPYIDVPIPLLGYDGLDFYINEDEDPLLAMWDRAWQKTIEGLLDAKARGILPRLMTVSNTQTPFN